MYKRFLLGLFIGTAVGITLVRVTSPSVKLRKGSIITVGDYHLMVKSIQNGVVYAVLDIPSEEPVYLEGTSAYYNGESIGYVISNETGLYHIKLN